jgi:opacity protein-like surface antigen
MRRLKTCALVAAVTVLWAAPAGAQFRVTPFFGGAFGPAAGESLVPGGQADSQWWAVGVNGGWTMGWLGIEADVAHFPQFFDSDGGFITDTRLMTAMGNVRLGIPIGMGMMGMGEGAMPYVSAGLGVIRPTISEAGALATVDESKFGWNAGGGLAGYFSDHVGLEGDVRYFRATDEEGANNAFGIDFNEFDFWRASIGVSLKW